MTTMPVLTLFQPWAQLVVAGRKTIETRSFSTKHRGPLAIHAGKQKADHRDPVYRYCSHRGLLDDDISPLVFGAIVATCVLVDVLPIHENGCRCKPSGEPYALVSMTGRRAENIVGLFSTVPDYRHPSWTMDKLDCLDPRHPRQQAPYGDYRCGRFAWLLDDVEPLDEPAPFKGGQGLSRRWTR